jgi:hypothetical protein
MSFPPSGGDGGNVEPGFEIEGGWGRDDAVGLLRRFYVQENERGTTLYSSTLEMNVADSGIL